MTLLALALAPGLMLLLYIYLQDKYEREPLKAVLRAFGLGAAAAIILVVIYVLLNFTSSSSEKELTFASAFVMALWHAAIPEEIIKFLPFLLFIYKNKEFNEWFDGIVYASAISLGFATIENILYVMQADVSTGIIRAVLAVPAHFIMGITQGFFFSLAKFGNKKVLNISLALIAAILVHAIYDAFIFSGKSIWLTIFIFYFVGIILLARKMISSHLEKSQFKI